MARKWADSGDALRYSGALITAVPLSVAVKFRLPNCAPTGGDGATHTIWMHRAAANDQGWYLEIRSGGLLRAGARDGSGANAAENSGNPVSDREWHWAFGRFVSDSDRYSSVDVGSEGNNIVARTPTTQTNILIGAGQGAGALYQNTGHDIEQVVLWNTSALSSGDRHSIYYGDLHPWEVMPDSIVSYVTLRHGEIRDRFGYEWGNEGDLAPTDGDPFVRDRPRLYVYGETVGAPTFNAAWNGAANSVHQSGGMAA